MSRDEAVAALRAEYAGFTSGMAWVPVGLLDEIATTTGAADRAQAAAAVAASIPVDLAFVSGGEPHGPDSVTTLHAADIAAVWAVDGVFTRVASAIGWMTALQLTAAEPAALTGRLDEALHDALLDVRQAFEFGADAVLVADDLAGPAGPLLAPDYTLDALLPCYRRLALEASVGGLPSVFHSDGDIRVLFPAVARAGFSAVHLAGLDADAFAQSAASARRSGLVVLGGISVQALSERARAEGEHAEAVARSLGGVIVCDDGGLTTLAEVAALGSAVGAASDAHRRPRA